MRDRSKRGVAQNEQSYSPLGVAGDMARSPLSPANRDPSRGRPKDMAVSFQSTGYNTRSAKKKLGMEMDPATPEQNKMASEEEQWAVQVTTRSRAAHAAQAAGAVGEAEMQDAESWNEEGDQMQMEDAGEGEGGRDVSAGNAVEDSSGQKRQPGGAPPQEHASSSTDGGGVHQAARAGGDRRSGGKGNPVVKLTVKLLHTYQEINEKYYAKHKGPCNDGYDDENGDYVIRQGDLINERYEVANRPGSKSPLLGKGSFGQVVYAIDRQSPQPHNEVALKIIKNHRHWHEQAKSEIELLRKFTKVPGKWGDADWVDYSNVVRLLDDFVFRSHCCLVFELLPFTLYDLLKYSRFKGVSLTLVRKFAYNLIRTLDSLRHPSIDVIHCDLKPENVMLVKYNEHRVKVIDFGSSCSSKRQPFTYIQSRFYRAPEVLLCRPYGHAIDMWSLGCILVEMHMGQPLFNGKNELQQMVKICDVLGLPPQHMILGAGSKSKVRKLFREKTASKDLILFVDDEPLENIPSKNFGRLIRKPMPSPHTPEEGRMYDLFEDLLLKMLTYDPSKRITPAEALKHPFFGRKESSGADMQKMQMSPRAESSDGEGVGSSSDKRRSNKVDQEVQTGEPSFLARLSQQESRSLGAGGSGAV